ncbi:hypothetical protein [Clostridium sp. MD294]|uniref:hypothetical protein n=1 Tax=Clostridium sp. MD294 TaxID=97138 RepID=UPI0002CA966C|nr:hypothetical protein [Clostridium sp. MD294]NDO45420.1 hypothetical protein [Clostridium sp. MD294]USF30935.1 hypothetical protein C820_002379 [Clostridium sp. MD294]
MNKKYQLKIIQCILALIFISIIIFGDFSITLKCFLGVLLGVSFDLDIVIKYISQWKTKKYIDNKKELIKDIIELVMICLFIVVGLTF